MSKINRLLLLLIAMVTIMLAAVGIDKGIKYWERWQWEKEREQQYEEAYAQAAAIRLTIEELSQDQQAIEAFIEENQAYFEELEAMEMQNETSASVNDILHEDPQKTGKEAEDETVGSVSTNDAAGDGAQGSVSANDAAGDGAQGSVSANDAAGDGAQGSVSANDAAGDGAQGSVSANDAAGDEAQDKVSINTVSGNDAYVSVWGNHLTLQEKRKLNSSYIETQNTNRIDKQIIAGSTVDFSDVKITCLGDSLTAATNLEKMENYRQYAYPARLQGILGAREVVNLGIGGSSIGRYWADAFVDRYREIPEDTDVILVMGGTNDGFCLTREDMGTLEDRRPRTFIGDLDELMRGLKTEYPDATIVFATPLPNVLHDMLRKERDYLLSQKEIADTIRALAKEHQIQVIDLYNSNILDSHDAAVIFNYMPDGVHGNQEGYQVLAEYMAARLIQLYTSYDVQTACRKESMQ